MKSLKRVLALLGGGLCVLAGGCPITDMFGGLLGG